MEILKHNSTDNIFEYYYSGEDEPLNNRDWSYDLFDNNENYKLFTCSTIDELVNFRIENFVFDICYLLSQNRPIRYDRLSIILATIVSKSSTLKSVSHNAITLNDREEKFIYNLPERYRHLNFNSILSVKQGPFTKRKINGVFFDVPEYYPEGVIFVGSIKECINRLLFPDIKMFKLKLMETFSYNLSLADEVLSEEIQVAMHKVLIDLDNDKLKNEEW